MVMRTSGMRRPPMDLRGLPTTLALAAIALALSACGLTAGDASDGPYARLGPPDAPVRLYVTEQGKGSPLLLIHGFGTNIFTWRRVAPALARDHRVITVDLKGFGQSDKPFDERYAPADQAELLVQLIEDRDLHDVTLVGHSFGGGVALLLALQADERLKGRISKLVLLDTIAYPQNVPVFFKLLSVPVMSQLGVRVAPSSWQIEVALKIAYFDDSKIDPQEVEAYALPMQSAAGKHAIIYSARQIMPDDLEQISARYNSITLPTLILWCDHDRIVPLDIGLKLRRAMPNSTFSLVSDCGHMPQEEQPEATLRLIRRFLGDPGSG
jgi:pimeloyl-ACP methyl ester carboxylesterase